MSSLSKSVVVRIFTAGHVDEGKSTLIGRLLYDSKSLFEDHLVSLARDSAKKKCSNGTLDYSLLTDGLKAEREQGITIDVAYRYFSTPKRSFILADSPGHEQYTRNMVTAASNSDALLLIVSAEHPLSQQTRRHSLLASLLGIRQFVIAVNKMDLIDYSESEFQRIKREYEQFSSQLSFQTIQFIPVSALKGDNIVDQSPFMPWYQGPALLEYLETFSLFAPQNEKPQTVLKHLLHKSAWRFPVQCVLRPKEGGRFYAGTLEMGLLRKGAEAVCLPSGQVTRIQTIIYQEKEVEEAEEGQAIAIHFETEIDAARGSMLAAKEEPPKTYTELEATLIWMDIKTLNIHAAYLLMHTTQVVPVRIQSIQHAIDIGTLQPIAANHLELNDVARVSLSLQKPIFADPYELNRCTGSFILIDAKSNLTVGAGLIHLPSRVEKALNPEVKSSHLVSSLSLISPLERAQKIGQTGCVVWFTGLPGSGKSTLALALEKRLFELGKLAYVLDGDVIRRGLNRDLGFSAEDRVENIRRIGETAALFADAGFIVIAACISPFLAGRERARLAVPFGKFLEVYLSTPKSCCESRDPKGHYQKARKQEIANFTGISSLYEPPVQPEITLDTSILSIETCLDRILAHLSSPCAISL